MIFAFYLFIGTLVGFAVLICSFIFLERYGETILLRLGIMRSLRPSHVPDIVTRVRPDLGLVIEALTRIDALTNDLRGKLI